MFPTPAGHGFSAGVWKQGLRCMMINKMTGGAQWQCIRSVEYLKIENIGINMMREGCLCITAPSFGDVRSFGDMILKVCRHRQICEDPLLRRYQIYTTILEARRGNDKYTA